MYLHSSSTPTSTTSSSPIPPSPATCTAVSSALNSAKTCRGVLSWKLARKKQSSSWHLSARAAVCWVALSWNVSDKCCCVLTPLTGFLNQLLRSGLSYQGISSYRRTQTTIRKGDGRQTVKLVRWEALICAVQVDEEFSAALFILGPGESRWLMGFSLLRHCKGENMLFVCGTTGGDSLI